MITYLNNSGIIIASPNYMLIIDGVTSEENLFDVQSDELKSYINNRLEAFKGQKIMLFTHSHLDHFCDEKVYQYIQNKLVDVLMLPNDKRFAQKCIKAAEGNSDIILMDSNASKEQLIKAEGLIINCFRSNHLPYGGYDGALHFSLSVHILERHYMIMGDADADSLKNVLTYCSFPISGLFITPVILGKTEWINPLIGKRIEKIYVYHLPSPTVDKYNYRKMAELKYKQYEDLLPNLKMLLNEREYLK